VKEWGYWEVVKKSCFERGEGVSKQVGGVGDLFCENEQDFSI
jgi:hypothetical protein